MNWLVLLIVLVGVVFMFSGGKVEKVPAKLKSSASRFTSDHKLIMGILIGGALTWFALGNSGCIEGLDEEEGNGEERKTEEELIEEEEERRTNEYMEKKDKLTRESQTGDRANRIQAQKELKYLEVEYRAEKCIEGEGKPCRACLADDGGLNMIDNEDCERLESARKSKEEFLELNLDDDTDGPVIPWYDPRGWIR